MRAALKDKKNEEEKEGDEAQPFSLAFSSLIVQQPFVRALIVENEAMLQEIAHLRRVRQDHAEERCQHVRTAETAARQLLAMLEAEGRLELCVAWQARLMGGLCDTLEELEALREENAALQQVIVKVQKDLGEPEMHSSLLWSDGDATPARVITAVDRGSKLYANYALPLTKRADSNSPRVSFRLSRKRGCESGDSWLFSPAGVTAVERSLSQQPT
ncbi:hypothetical protein TRSC58_02282 [Trypanosoma rangeli SC58]|uniref:Uncharacterized protein n=1 Tax=Trypanosoma rangeli SC58 TaxID=429131 RepID=A0A061J6M9_TRYRA|nr:hypothetical protein TRSC58_02282 [Trypanosoma rangeli SC58]